MATLMFFEDDLKDQKRHEVISLEFGRSSFYSEDSMYVRVDGKLVILTRKQAIEFVSAMMDCAAYLGLDKE